MDAWSTISTLSYLCFDIALDYYYMRIIYLLAILTVALAEQELPVQKGGYGFSVGDPYGTLHIEFFLDFQCTQISTQAPIQNNPTTLGSLSEKQSASHKITLS